MSELISNMSIGMIVIAGAVFAHLMRGRPAAYGRHNTGQLPGMAPKYAWMLQESPSFFIPLYYFCVSETMTGQYLNALMVFHYFMRTFVYPFCIKTTSTTPYSVVAAAFCFCLYNGFMQGIYNAYYCPEQKSFRFLSIGTGMFFISMNINHMSDLALRKLRASGETGYKIPTGFLYDYVSCPNYLGEILEWIGYAIASHSLPAIAFAVFTAANLIPRALSHHAWYKEKFEDYPADRKAIIPYLL